jgi:PAS domain S-box-containing protein
MVTSGEARLSAEHPGSRLEFEMLISDTSAALLAAVPEELDLALEGALESVRKYFRVDRCALLSIRGDPPVVSVRLAAYAPGVEPVPADLDLAPLFPWSRRRMLDERLPVRVSKRADLPPEADAEREAWVRLPIQSALSLPIETRGDVSHLIVLNTVRDEHEWPEAFVKRLRVLGELLVGAMERQAMIAGLREAEARVSLAADCAEAGLWMLDCTTGTYWASERARALFGYSPDERLDLARLEAKVHPEDWDLVRGALERSQRDGAPIAVEYRILPGEGRLRWISSRGRSRFKPTGAPERLMGVSIDVTERRLAEEALHRSEARLASGADLAGLALYEVDFAARLMYTNERLRDICGVPPGQIHGLQVLEFWMEHVHPEDRARVLQKRQQLHDGGLERLCIEYRYLHPIHGVRWIHHAALVAKRSAEGIALATFGVLRDITHRKRTEDELQDLSQRLIRAHEEERALLARELHDDVTQRLAVLAIDLGRAEATAPGTVAAETMRGIREGLVRLSEDVHSLAYQLHPSVLEELGLVEALRTECERMERRGQIRISVSFDPLPEGIGKEVALCLFRVTQEALNNVVRHARARTASVGLRQMDGGLLLAVRDDGTGFDPQDPGKGRSLGLASMRERVRLTNGTLDIESAPGRGTTVVAWVPVKEESP